LPPSGSPLLPCTTLYRSGMGYRYARVAEYGRVREVALQSRYRKFGRKMFEQGIGNPQVSLGIFEVDRVNFMRHGRRTNLALGDFLLEIIHRDVGPDVSA